MCVKYAQVENALEHFVKIHGQVDGFGSKSIAKLVEGGIDIRKYISKNLRSELDRSLVVETEDWRLLGAFNSSVGSWYSRRLLQHYKLKIYDE